MITKSSVETQPKKSVCENLMIHRAPSHLATQCKKNAIRLPITVVIPVKNEAQNLPNCLSLLSCFQEVWVVDSGSTDSTSTIAKDHGARVLQFDWQGGFPKKRNWVLINETFATEWVLFLDADEQITPAFIDEVSRTLPAPNVSGYWLNYTNHFMGKTLNHGVPQRKLAMFRVGAGLYERIEDPGWSRLDMEIHEHPVLEGKIGEIASRIDHRDFRGIEQFIARHNSYSSWEAHRYGQLIEAGPDGWNGLTKRQKFKYQMIRKSWFSPLYFVMTYILRFGFMDGMPGLDYALLKMSYFHNIRLKMMEIEQAP